MRLRAALVLAGVLVAAPLASAQDAPQPRRAAPKLPPLGAPAGAFGEPLELERATPLATVAEDPASFHGQPLRFEGEIVEVCQKKGCWLLLRDGEHEARVRFAGYRFLVPRDAAGRRAILEGIVSEKTISAEAARHYAEEAGDAEAAAAIEGPQKVLMITATGVEVLAREATPPLAEGTPEAVRALLARIAAGEVRGRLAAPPAGLAAAHAGLQQVPGARTRELSFGAVVEGWFAFSAADAARPFAAGYAVEAATGKVVAFGGAAARPAEEGK